MSDKLQFVARCAKAAQKQQTEVRRKSWPKDLELP